MRYVQKLASPSWSLPHLKPKVPLFPMSSFPAAQIGKPALHAASFALLPHHGAVGMEKLAHMSSVQNPGWFMMIGIILTI